MPDRVKEKLVELLAKYFDIGDSYAYNLTRVKSAFACGTMGFDDFEEFDEETVEDIASYLVTHGVTVLAEDLPNPPLEEMDLSVRAYNVLKRAGLKTAQDIAELDYTQILRIRNIGKHTYDEIVSKMEALGYNTEKMKPGVEQ